MAGFDMSKKELKPAQYQAVIALVNTGDVIAAARAATVSERTLRRWMTMPIFRAQLQEAENEMVRTAARRLGGLADKALTVLENVLDKDDIADNPRIRAATAVLDTCLKWREQVLVEERLRVLEQRLRSKR